MKKVFKFWPLFLIVIFITLFFLTPFFIRINKIVCTSQYGECNKVFFEKLKKTEGGSLYISKLNINKILKGEAMVSAYTVYFKLPDILKINVLERKPKFVLTNSEKKHFLQIDKDYLVLSGSDSTDLPYVITQVNLPKEGSLLDKKYIFALNLQNDINSIFQVREGVIENDTLLIELQGNLRVIFPLEGDREALIGSLILINNELKKGPESKIIDSEQKVSLIDLRFKNPVLKMQI